MHKLIGVSSLALLIVLVLSACGQAVAPDTGEIPATEILLNEPENEVPVEPTTEAPAELEVIDLAGPTMEVGSTYVYVDGSTLVAVPAGAFIMGRNSSDNPEHEVTLSDFWIYRTKVTNRQFQLCVNTGECDPPDPENNPDFLKFENQNKPVTGVNWEQAQAYCSFVHSRLPTEAEWEKTARGPEGNIYPWGDGAPACDLLNFDLCVGQTTKVTDYPQGKSYYDALDMAGNAYEWVADWYDPFYYRSGPAQDPPGPETGDKRSVRGTAYNSMPERTPSAVRWSLEPALNDRDLGFRCVVEDPTYFAPMCEQLAYYGTGPGSSTNPIQTKNYDCPNLDIITAPQKCDSNSTYVTFKYPDNWSPPIAVVDGGCALISNPPNPVYDCNAPTTVSLSGVCQFTGGLSPATCASHYNYDSNTGTCVWDGTGALGGECLPGQTYDPVNQCCSAQPGSGNDYNLCDPGSSPVQIDPNTYACLDGNVAPPPPLVTAAVSMPPACGGGTEGGGCNVSPSSCRYGFDQDQCCCISPTGGGCQ